MTLLPKIKLKVNPQIPGTPGPPGPTGPSGSTGPVGPAGPAGTSGSIWFTGTGNPPNASTAGAVPGDLYLDNSDGEVWKNVAGNWTLQTDITGPQGPPGASGSGSGNVSGPGIAVINDRVAVWNGTTGTAIKDGGKTIAEILAASGGSTASLITNVPAGNIVATNVQAAINELDSEKVAKAGDTMTGNLTVGVGGTIQAPTIRAQYGALYTANGTNTGVLYFGDGSAGTGSIFFNTRFDFSGGRVNVTDNTSSISPGTGALTVLGGLGVSGNINTPTPTAGDNSTKVATTAFVTTAVAAGGGGASGGGINCFRNGTFDIWQRGTTPVAVLGTYTYVADGWAVDYIGAVGAVSRVANSGTGAKTLYAMQMAGNTSTTGLLARQRIESNLAAQLAGKNVTVQFRITNNSGASFSPSVSVNRANAADNFGAVTAELASTALQSCPNAATTLVAYTFALSASAANGIEVLVDFTAAGMTTTGKTIAVAEADIQATPSATVGLNAAPPSPEFRPYSSELLICQRYFSNSYPNAIAPGTATQYSAYSFVQPAATTVHGATYTPGKILFMSQMRVAPTILIYGFSGAVGKVSDNGGTDLAASSGIAGGSSVIGFYVYNFSGVTVTHSFGIFFHFSASAEL